MIKRHELVSALVGLAISIPISVFIHHWRVPAPIEFYQRHASQTVVKAGDVVNIRWKERRMNDCDSVSYRRLIAADNTVINFEPMYYPAKEVGTEIHGYFEIKIPPGLKQGPLIYRVYTEFFCNWIQKQFGGHRFVMPDIIFDYRRTET